MSGAVSRPYVAVGISHVVVVNSLEILLYCTLYNGDFQLGTQIWKQGVFSNVTRPDGPGIVMGYLLAGKYMTTVIHMGRSPFRKNLGSCM